MGNSCFHRQLALMVMMLATAACRSQAQGVATPQPNQPVASSKPVQPQVSQPTSLLQEPARPAQVALSGASLSIHADNSSLSAILHDIGNVSGMKIEGLGGDERVFGSFGPGAPRDVIADLLNGTAYNLVLLGDLDNGAPRELILTPASHGGGAAAAPVAGPQMNNEENEPEAAEMPPPQPEPPPEQPNQPQAPAGGVKTPQQLFEQLQRLRSGQGQSQDQQPQ